MNHYKCIKRELEHQGVLVEFYSDYMELPNGNNAKWDFIKHNGAAAVVAVNSEGKIIMVRQYRHAIDKYSLEIPAGGLNKGEDMRSCAMRELEEETGFHTEKMEHLIDIYTTVAFCNEKIGIYYTDDLVLSKQKLDEDEFVTVETYTMEELVKLILDGVIEDSKTISGILAYKSKMNL